MANYNGHELPVLPEWLRSKYPHAVISVTESATGTSYTLYALDQMGYWGAGAWYADGEFVETYQGLILSDVYDPAAGQVEQFATCQWTYDPAGDTWALRFSDKYETCIGISGSIAEIGVTFRVIWSNTEILDANGELYLAASPEPGETPEPTVTALETWISGYMVGLADGYRKKAAVAYLYNGVKLPALPKWEKSVYPYAYITYESLLNKIYHLWLSPVPIYAKYFGGGYITNSNGIPLNAIRYGAKTDDASWEYVGVWESKLSHVFEPIWADRDMYLLDWDDATSTGTVTDTVYIEGSAPVPVYE